MSRPMKMKQLMTMNLILRHPQIVNNKYGKRTGRYELWSRKQRDYSYQFATKSDALKKSDHQTRDIVPDA